MKNERNRFLNSFIYPIIFVSFIWLIKFFELVFEIRLVRLGLKPMNIDGLQGILFSPLIHSDFSHLFSNSIPIIVLGFGLFYFYKEIAFKIFGLSYVFTGILVWLFSDGEAYHIGASGVVYALAAFHLLSGFLRKHISLIAFSLVVVFLYGGMFWGVFPEMYPNKNISWESHLMGTIVGVSLSFYFRKTGIQKEEYDWDDEYEEEEADNMNPTLY